MEVRTRSGPITQYRSKILPACWVNWPNAYAATERYRKSISGHWKANAGSSVLEKVPMNERFKQWVDEVSRMFGGLDICSVEALQSKTGEYFIYEVNGSDITLFGESQEEARREITELVLQRMQTVCAQNVMYVSRLVLLSFISNRSS
ncbi:hypothetical protein AHF37_06485 [Paragonimus kellicotti]|nr:hypothetical protein AHF37_06485 [Paragonimus kellicotti]